MSGESAGQEYVRVGESRPIPKTVDWDNAPSVFKLYRGGPKMPLNGQFPLGQFPLGQFPLGQFPLGQFPLGQFLLGQFLRDVYGLVRQRWFAPSEVSRTGRRRAAGRTKSTASTTSRPVPAGGARYPCELYLLAGPDQPLPAGVYHYDPAHHYLDVLRDGAPEAGLSLLISVAFWKNVFKYGEFSYRLHSLDAGVVLGQILAVAARYALEPTVHFQFSDAALDRFLGLDPGYESVYAVITLAQGPAVDPASTGTGPLISQPVTGHPSSIGLYPLPAKLHQVAMQQGGGPWPKGERPSPVLADAPAALCSVPLPVAPLDLLAGLDRRRSAKGHFRSGTVSRDQLSALLSGSMRGYASDLGADEPAIRNTMLVGAIHNVEGIDSGVYYYDPARHSLEQLRAGDVCAELQAAITSLMFNMFQINLCFFPVANYTPRLASYGDRWYRVQNMEAGIIVQRLYLAAAALGLGCHTQLGFHVDAVNELLGLAETPLTSLIQVLIAPCREAGIFYDHRL